ncbi:autotransporter-associated beta strand repeat-containing protein, partial [Variovorax paradoxus]|nr:autotransporter-associated beta strand repeat-containing protein [Variovorax paradoxus]
MNHAYRVLWNRAKQAWVVASELAPSVGKASCKSARNPLRRAGVKSSRRSITAAACMGVFSGLLSVGAAAATYSVADETQLRQAIAAANADGDPNSSITLTSDIVVTNPAALPAAIKPITLNTGAFTLIAPNGSGTAAGRTVSIGGGTYNLSGRFRGGSAGTASDNASAGGAAVTMTGGTLRNNAAVSGGTGGPTTTGSLVTTYGGTGGAGISLSGGTAFTNEAGGVITGGKGGSLDNRNINSGSTGNRGGGTGGIGLVMTGGGGMDNLGTITGGASGDAFAFNGAADNIFTAGGGLGASLTGGSHVNSGTITGGAGGAGWNNTSSGNGVGGGGVQLAGAATLLNNGTIRGANGRLGGGGPAGGGSGGGLGATVNGSTLVNGATGTIRGGNSGAIVGAGGGNLAVSATGSTIVNSGAIIGGSNGNGTTATAIGFAGGNNTLELRAGSSITGLVTAAVGDRLALGGTTNASFNSADIGPAAQYRGFGRFEKRGSSTWTLTGTTTATTPWQILGGTLSVAQDASLGATAGALTINGGILQVTGTSFTSTARAINWGAAGGGFDIADPANTFTVGQSLTGGGPLQKLGAGTLVFTGTNTYAGGTTISAGTLQLGNGGTTGSITGDVVNNAALVFDRSDTTTFAGQISGTGALRQQGTGTTVLTGANSYTGGTTIAAGTLQLGNGGTSGSIVGDVVNNGTLVLDRSDTLSLAGLISGTGTLTQQGTGTTVLTGANSYSGATDVVQGTLVVNGNQSLATGATTVRTGATLAGTGTLGGPVTVESAATLSPGQGGPGTLTMGALTLNGGAVLAMDMGARGVAGGALNDLVAVNGNLTLDGTLNVASTPGTVFDPGLYRLINYTGALTNNTLDIGTLPASAIPGAVSVQTAVANQVNLINASGVALRFWDGPANHDNGAFDGTSGLWRAGGDRNWTDADPAVNGNWADNAFAVFLGTPGTVSVDDSAGPVSLAGAQFAVDGYTVNGPGVLNTSTPQTVIRVGDGTAAGQSMTATINATIAGTGGIVKSDLGTLVLGADNSYTGGTTVGAGTLQIARDANLGAAAGALALDGGTLRVSQDLQTARAIDVRAGGGAIDTMAHTVTATGALSGSGDWAKLGTGTL